MDEKKELNPTKTAEASSTRTQIVENDKTVIREEENTGTHVLYDFNPTDLQDGKTVSKDNTSTVLQEKTSSNTTQKPTNTENKYTAENQKANKSSANPLLLIIIIVVLLVAISKLLPESDDTTKIPDNNLLSSSYNEHYNNSQEDQKQPNSENDFSGANSNTINSKPDTSSDTAPEPPTKIVGNLVRDSFEYKGQENHYSYTASKSGRHIVYLDVSNANADFDIKVISPTTAILKSINYVAAKYDKSRAEFPLYLEEGETYIIKTYQDTQLCDYTIEITAP
ncbi:MAG: hypothetical protein J6V50_03970 [Clostridia bacterium]|nr:hypothetical protein [Clostridia bacterium]